MVKTALKPLPPAWREKNRYLAFELMEGSTSKEDLSGAIMSGALSLYGEIGVSEMNLRLVDFEENSGKGVIKVERSHVEDGRMALAFVSSAGRDKTPVALKVIGVSGSLKKARSFVI